MENLLSNPEDKRLTLYFISRFGCYNSTELASILGSKNNRFKPLMKLLLPEDKMTNQQALYISQEEPADHNTLFSLYRCQDFTTLEYKEKDAESKSVIKKKFIDSSFGFYALALLLLSKEKYVIPHFFLTQVKDSLGVDILLPKEKAIRYFRNTLSDLEKLGYVQRTELSSSDKEELLKDLLKKQPDSGEYHTYIYENVRNPLKDLTKEHLLALYKAITLVQDILPLSSILYLLKATIYENYYYRHKDSRPIPKTCSCNNASFDNILQDSTLYSIILAYEEQRPIRFKYYPYGRKADVPVLEGIPVKISCSSKFNAAEVFLQQEDGAENSFRLEWMYLEPDCLVKLEHQVHNKYFAGFRRLTQNPSIFKGTALSSDLFELACKNALSLSQLDEAYGESELQEFMNLLLKNNSYPENSKNSSSEPAEGNFANSMNFFSPIFSKNGDNLAFIPRTSMPLLMSLNEKRYLKTLLDFDVFESLLNISPKIQKKSLCDFLKEELKDIKPWPFKNLLEYDATTTPLTALEAMANNKAIPIISEAFKNGVQLSFQKEGQDVLVSPYKLVFRPTGCNFRLIAFDSSDKLLELPMSRLENLALSDNPTQITDSFLKHVLYIKQILSHSQARDHKFIQVKSSSNRTRIHKFVRLKHFNNRSYVCRYSSGVRYSTKPLSKEAADNLLRHISSFRKQVILLSKDNENDTETYQIILHRDQSLGEVNPKKTNEKLIEQNLIDLSKN